MLDAAAEKEMDESSSDFVTIRQDRGDKKIIFRMERLNPVCCQPVAIVPLRKKMEQHRHDDTRHDLSLLIDTYINYGKYISCEDLQNNPAIQRALENLKFNAREHQNNTFAVLVKGIFCECPINDEMPLEELLQKRGTQGAIIYLFFKDSKICFHRYFHEAKDKKQFEEDFKASSDSVEASLQILEELTVNPEKNVLHHFRY